VTWLSHHAPFGVRPVARPGGAGRAPLCSMPAGTGWPKVGGSHHESLFTTFRGFMVSPTTPTRLGSSQRGTTRGFSANPFRVGTKPRGPTRGARKDGAHTRRTVPTPSGSRVCTRTVSRTSQPGVSVAGLLRGAARVSKRGSRRSLGCISPRPNVTSNTVVGYPQDINSLSTGQKGSR
jgi:hypothetical protein